MFDESLQQDSALVKPPYNVKIVQRYGKRGKKGTEKRGLPPLFNEILGYHAFMPRIARIIIEDIPYHVTQRGNRRQDVFGLSVYIRRL